MTTSSTEPRRSRIALFYSSCGRFLRVSGLRLDLEERSFELPPAVVDTGLDIAILGPELPEWSDVRSRSSRIHGIAGQARKTRLRAAVVSVDRIPIPGEHAVHTIEMKEGVPEQEWMVGLPVLRHFHLLLAVDRSLSQQDEPWMYPPPLRPALTQVLGS